MGRYYDMVKANYNKLRNDESVMWGSIELWDRHLEDMREHHPDKYWEIMRNTHEIMQGKHYNEAYAKWKVEQMHHKSPEGKVYKGEHWTKEETDAVLSKFRGKIPSTVNEYDFYVALNSSWHDFGCWAKSKFATDAEAELGVVELAIAYWFNDADYKGEGKVWHYLSVK